jgi:Bardet-Biedl syndrome 7 protein
MAMGSPITCVTLGEVGNSSKERAFVSCAQKIVGVTKKGTEFVCIKTNMTETIQAITVHGESIWTIGQYIYNLFDTSGKDTHFFMCHDRINHLSAGKYLSDTNDDVALACQDRFVRLLQGNVEAMSCQVDGPVTEVLQYKSKGSDGTEKIIVYGTESGTLGQLQIDGGSRMRKGWTVSADRKMGTASINALHCYDLTKDGVNDILCGRDDGSVQVFSFDLSPEPVMNFNENVNESIRSIVAGNIIKEGFDEIVVGTFSGKVVSYTTEELHLQDESDSHGRSKETVANPYPSP